MSTVYEKLQIFRLSGEFAHWRKWFTTTSALTFSFPPRTAIIGLVGAVLGIQRDDVPIKFPADQTRIAVSPLVAIEKSRLAENWRQTPPQISAGKFRYVKMHENFQSNMEVIRRPCYRIFFWHEDTRLLDELKRRLQQKRYVYTPYLGILGFLAKIEWEGEDTAHESLKSEAEICTVLPLDEESAKHARLKGTSSYVREERIPNEVFPGRQFSYLHLAYVPRDANMISVQAEKEVLSVFELKERKWCGMFLEQNSIESKKP
ncbi:MAG: type I-B CRISPR-associated protein Cas5 [Acidobacteria bacterium]|jgi:CRISPR-associated protein Cas5h|nr:MAG: type I-B CRISPR-associated protein Cas5 [Acidobacteriota bacterium]GIU82902.1 MAG: type I-B CRISPR-associated protein Cas5 [Pyrinomonadaceae bacterium]